LASTATAYRSSSQSSPISTNVIITLIDTHLGRHCSWSSSAKLVILGNCRHRGQPSEASIITYDVVDRHQVESGSGSDVVIGKGRRT
jgi:hypothetical protein